MPKPKQHKLECYECHVAIEAELDQAFEWMQSHVRQWHGRELAFTKEQYANMTRAARMMSDQLLYGLMLAC